MRAKLLALFEEATKNEEPLFLVLWCTDARGAEIARRVHAPIAAVESETARRSISTHIGVDEGTGKRQASQRLNVEGCDDEETMEIVVRWIYGFSFHSEKSPRSIEAAIKLMRVASYMQMHELQSECNSYIDDWAFERGSGSGSIGDHDMGKCIELWQMLSSTSIEGATEGPTGAVREALMRLIMQRGATGPTGPVDPMTVDFIRGCSLENLALLTTGACSACAVDLALAWKKIHAPESDAAVLAHIPLEALPVMYIEGLIDSGRLAGDDKHRALQCVGVNVRPVKRARSTCTSIPTVGWAGVFMSTLSTIDSELTDGALTLRPIGVTGIRKYEGDVEEGTGHPPAMVMNGSAFVFSTDVGVMRDTGYVYSTFDPDPEKTWRPFGIIPPFMAYEKFGSVVYGTSIVFVRMTGRPSRPSPSCVAFDVAKCTWRVLPDAPARQSPCIAVVDGSLYVIGGTAETAVPYESGSQTERIRLDQCLSPSGPLSCQWEKVGMPIARKRSAAVVIDKSIYVTGGLGREHGTWSVSSALTRLDTVTGAVEEMSPMVSGRCTHGSFVSSDGQIVVLDGARGSQTPVERFDFDTLKWYPLRGTLSSCPY
jgi:hypothetical protein